MERWLVFGLIGLMSGSALLLIGLVTTLRARWRAIRSAIERFAATNSLEYRSAFDATDLPLVGPLGRGTERNCTAVAGVKVAGHTGLVFLFDYYVRGSGGGGRSHKLVLLLPDAWRSGPTFALHPRYVRVWSGGDEFTRTYRIDTPGEPASQTVLVEELRERLLAHRELAVQAAEGHLVIWDEPSVTTQLQLEWRRSLRPFDAWVADAIHERLAIAELLLAPRQNDREKQ